MAAKFFALLTNVGAAKLSNMAALGEKLEITSLAVGDGGGVSPTPSQAQTKLINERRRAPLNSLSVDEKNDSQIIAEQIIPESAGGWWIREIGLFDADGDLIAIANCPETYKATTEEGSGRTQVIRMLLTVSSTDAVTLKVDPSVVLATRQYVDDAVIEVKSYADKLIAAHEAKANPHKQYPLTANALKEMADAGLVAEVLKNLGLGEGSALPVGVPVPWPSATPPTGWLKCNGAAFSAEEYPELAKAYPTNKLPDLRGEFIRGWDDGRGIDPGRILLASQEHAMQNVTGSIGKIQLFKDLVTSGPFRHNGNNYLTTGLTAVTGPNSGGSGVTTFDFDMSRVANTANETRPVNVAFNYIVRAA
ncbi:phage tail protein [Escherichia coli]|nr:phage tail protein [Escherichia coli]